MAATTAGTAKAGLINGGCPSGIAAFKSWGDSASYYFASNGGFEGGTKGWSVHNATVVSGNEPWDVSGSGSHALQIPAGGSAATNVCYGLTYPGARFFVAGVNGSATIHVRVLAQSLLGVLSILDGGTFTVSQGWQPGPKVSTLFSALAAPLGTKSMQLQISVVSGTAQIDDLYVDPFLAKL